MTTRPSFGGTPGTSDHDLVAGCLAGRAGAWDEFVAGYGGLFAHVAARTAAARGQPLGAAEREDAVAEVLLECLTNDAAVLRAFSGRSSLATYLAVVARRVTVRRLLRGAAAAVAAWRDVDAAAAGPREPSRLEDREQVEALLGHLEGDEARLVRLHHLEARSYGEISRLTGLPLGSIGPALSRARRKLRELMESPGPR